MSGKEFSRDELDQLAALAALPEDRIDTADIPEAPARNWQLARRGSGRNAQGRVTISLDADVAEWFRDHADDGGYEAEINDLLRRYVLSGGKAPA